MNSKFHDDVMQSLRSRKPAGGAKIIRLSEFPGYRHVLIHQSTVPANNSAPAHDAPGWGWLISMGLLCGLCAIYVIAPAIWHGIVAVGNSIMGWKVKP